MKPTHLVTLALLFLTCVGAGWQQLNEAGKTAYARGDYALAEALFRQAVAAAPEEAEVHYHLGVALTQLRRWTEATAAYEKTLTLGPPAPLATAARQALHSVKRLARFRASAGPETGAAPLPRSEPSREDRLSDSVDVSRRGNHWFVEVVINDASRWTFLVDTGAGVCAVTPEVAEVLGIVPDPDEPPILVRGVTGNAWGRRITIPSVRVGSTEAHDVGAIVLPLPGLHGILGNTFLARYIATLDPTRARLTLQRR